MYRVYCDLSACPLCEFTDTLGQLCVVTDYSDDFLYLPEIASFELVSYVKCSRYVTSIHRDQVICYKEFAAGSKEDCRVTLNDQSCSECCFQTCDEQFPYNDLFFDCSNRGGSIYDFCQPISESPDSPFFLLDNEFYADFEYDGRCQELLVKPPPPGSIVTSIIGNPHIATFDALEFDCQAAGEFVLLKSLDSSLQIQGRFEAVPGGAAQASVTTGVAVTVPDGSSTVQISTLPFPDESCTPLFFTDGLNTTPLFPGDTVRVGPGVTLSATEQSYLIKYDNGLTVTLLRRDSISFGCFFLLVLAAPNTSERLIRLFGSPNGDPNDDWTDAFGNPLPIPPGLDLLFEPAYNYCVQNWCIQNPEESLFTYNNSDSRVFSDFYKCDQPFDTSVLDAYNSAIDSNSELTTLCGDDAACLVDGVIGTLDDARTYKTDLGAATTSCLAAASSPMLSPTRSPTDSLPPTAAPDLRPPPQPQPRPKQPP